jgi:hypothetical protein
MVNKKGFLRIVEAIIAVMIIFGALLMISSQSRTQKIDTLGGALPKVLQEMAENKDLRQSILSYNLLNPSDEPNNENILNNLEQYAANRIKNPTTNLSIAICELEKPCALSPYPLNADGEIFAAERVVSAGLGKPEFEPRKIKIFLWRIGN